MTWRKLSDCQWAAGCGIKTFRVLMLIDGYQASIVHCPGNWVVRVLGTYADLPKAKRRCEAERIMG